MEDCNRLRAFTVDSQSHPEWMKDVGNLGEVVLGAVCTVSQSGCSLNGRVQDKL